VRSQTAAGLALAAITLAACGDGEEPTSTAEATTTARPGPLTTEERNLVEDSEQAIVAYCRRSALALTRPRKRPTVNQQSRALEAVDALLELASEKPDARLSAGADVRLFVGDLTENLEGANCDPGVIARLDQGLAALP
jgi:hypothetical protein